VLPLVAFCCQYEKFGRDHTMCQYTGRSPNVRASGMNEAGRTAALRTHNQYRQRVANGQERGQPGATNMMELTWDNELATIAQRWSDQCTWGHDKNRRTEQWRWVGQNMYMSMSTANSCQSQDWPGATKAWYDEVTKPGFSANDIEPYKFSSGTGHYTAVVWADTTRVGCGYTCCYNANSQYKWEKIYACNYGSGGNIQGAAMYKRGRACSACKNGCSSTYNGLCRP